jgi:regulator of replication initiation timing
MFQATTQRIFSKLDNLQKMLEIITKNQETMKDEIKSIKEEVAILSFDQGFVDVSKDIKF